MALSANMEKLVNAVVDVHDLVKSRGVLPEFFDVVFLASVKLALDVDLPAPDVYKVTREVNSVVDVHEMAQIVTSIIARRTQSA